jgi:hypothetical protein
VSKPTRFLIWMLLLFLLAGLVDPHISQPSNQYSPLTMIYAIALATLIFGWCKAHAAARGIALPSGAAPLAAFLAPIGVPLYFFRSMPAGAALVSTLKASGFLGGLVFVYALAGYISGTFAT